MSDLSSSVLVLCYGCNRKMTDKQTVLVEVEPMPGRCYCSGLCRIKVQRTEGKQISAEWRKIQYTPGLESAL